jgi:hypothetical protein
VNLVPRPGVAAGDRDLGRARAVHLDDPVAEAARLEAEQFGHWLAAGIISA